MILKPQYYHQVKMYHCNFKSHYNLPLLKPPGKLNLIVTYF
jgi:hypothetical protein